MDPHAVFLALASVLVSGPLRTSCVSSAPWIGSCPDVCRCGYEDGAGTVLKVDCVDRGLRAVPENVSDVTSILDLSMNRVTELPARGFTGLASLRQLRLAGNRLQQIHSDAFHGLHKLTELTLHDTDLRTVPSEALDKLRDLQSLRLDANRLSVLPSRSFRGLSSLRFLWLEDNQLRETPGGALSHVPQLQALTLGMNRLTHLPPRGFHALHQLQVLLLHHNQIHSLSPTCFSGLHRLQTLDLSFNRLHTFPAVFQLLPSLQDLNLQNNGISFVPENALRGNLLSLKEINVLNNPLFVIGSFTKLSKLPTLGFPVVSQKNPSRFQYSKKNQLDFCQTPDSSWSFSLLLFISIVFLTALALLSINFLFKVNARKYDSPL